MSPPEDSAGDFPDDSLGVGPRDDTTRTPRRAETRSAEPVDAPPPDPVVTSPVSTRAVSTAAVDPVPAPDAAVTAEPVTPKPVTPEPVTPEPLDTGAAPGVSQIESGRAPEVDELLVTPEPETAPAPAAAAPRALATVSTPGAAASSFADTLEDLLGPIQALFEGVALLVRRTLFNEAPTVNPVQLTGQSEGPITGTIGAVDPEDDPLTFTVTSDPRYGTVSLTPAGTYTYTPGPDFTGTDSFVVTATDGGFRINLLNPFRPSGTAASVSLSQGDVAALLRFQFVYGAGSQYWSTEARSALEAAAQNLSSYFVVSSPVTLTYAVTGEFSPLSATLASAGSDFAAGGPGFLPTVAQRKIQTGIDANGTAPDGTIAWNFGPSWGFGSTVAGNQYDFQTIAMHELVHTLGFLTYVDRAGANTGRTWTEYDSYLMTANGSPVIGSDYVWNTTYNANLTGGNGGLYFGGPNAVAANGGAVRLHTPDPWVPGSSVSHLAATAEERLMTARVNRGPSPRVLSTVELAILRDLGYTIAPGPGGATVMLIGIVFLRRRRRNT